MNEKYWQRHKIKTESKTFKNSGMDVIRSWREQKILLKRRFPILKDEDLEFEEGNKESMLSKLADRLSKTRLELEIIFKQLQLH